MVQANELKLNNIVIDDFGRIYKVVQIGEKLVRLQIERFDHQENKEYDEISGIYITPDWLERAGFVKRTNSDDQVFWRKGECDLEDFGGKYEFLTGTFYYYVHQLQNLYFAITGHELEFK